jgi:hypothetical protein
MAAHVVPCAIIASQSSRATSAAYARSANRASSGKMLRSSQSSSGPLALPITRVCGKWTCVSTNPGSSTVPGWVSDSGESGAAGPTDTMRPAASSSIAASASSSKRGSSARGQSTRPRSVRGTGG